MSIYIEMKDFQWSLILFSLAISCTQPSQLVEQEIPSNLPEFEILLDNDDAFEGYIFSKGKC